MYLASTRQTRGAYTKRPSSVQSIAKKALRIAKSADSRTLKSKLTTVTNETMAINSGAIAIKYLEPLGGDTQTIKLKSISGKIEVRGNLTSTEHAPYRVDLVLDRRPNNLVIDPSDVYDGASTKFITNTLTYDYNDRYKIVKTWHGILTPNINQSRIIDVNVRSNLILEGSTGGYFAQGDANKNAYYLLYRSDCTTTAPIISYNLELITMT